MYGIDLAGEAAVVAGVSNRWSIAWAIAQVLHDAGARLVLPYLSERERGGIQKLVADAEWDDVVLPPEPCNVARGCTIALPVVASWRPEGRARSVLRSFQQFLPHKVAVGGQARQDFSILGLQAVGHQARQEFP